MSDLEQLQREWPGGGEWEQDSGMCRKSAGEVEVWAWSIDSGERWAAATVWTIDGETVVRESWRGNSIAEVRAWLRKQAQTLRNELDAAISGGL